MGLGTSPTKWTIVWSIILIMTSMGGLIGPGPYPYYLGQLHPFTIGVIFPLFAILEGVAIAWIWEGIRNGFTLALGLAIVAILLNVVYGLAFLSAGQLLPLATMALSNIIIGAVAALAARHGLKGRA